MEKINLLETEEFMKKTIKKAGRAIQKLYKKTKVIYTKKNKADVVTQADLISNKLIMNAIKKKHPNHGIISEEEKNHQENADYVWIIDPLDGTRNYSTGFPIYGVIIALAKKTKKEHEVIMGAVYLPELKELYFASKGKGASLNNEKIKITNNNFEHSYGVINSVLHKGETIKTYQKLISYSKKKPFWINVYGCAALQTTIVAAGKRDWTIISNIGGVWDVAGPYIILKEAGAKVTNIKGKPWTLKDSNMIAGNAKVHTEIMKILK